MFEKGDRERTRVKYSSKVDIKREGGKKTITGLLRDIGMESIYVYSDLKSPPESGEEVEIKITIKGKGSKLSIESSGRVSRIDKDGFAIVFSTSLEWWPIFISFPQHAKYYKGIDPI